MKKDKIVQIISEEISNFDFLGIEEQQDQQEVIELLKNEDFQKQFICDSLLNVDSYRKTERDSKIKIHVTDAQISGDWEDDFEDASYITLDYFLRIEYSYDSTKNPAKFTLTFYGDRISINKDGWYDRGRLGGTPDTDIEPSGDAWFSYLSWDDIKVDLFTEDGEEIKFIAFERAPAKIQELFIREYVESYIENNTLEVRTREKISKNAVKAEYC